MTDTASVDFKIRGNRYRIKGAKWFYDDGDVRSKIGADLTDEADLSGDDVFDKKVTYQRKLIRLVAVLKRDSIAGNAAQSSRSRQFRFWCRPDRVSTAMTGLLNKTIDPSVLPGSYKIVKVMPSVDSNLC